MARARVLARVVPPLALVLASVAAPAPAQVSSCGPDGCIGSPDRGQRLYEEACLSCHGPAGRGGEAGPPLDEVGAAAVDFQLRTGRMPLAAGQRTSRKPPAFDAQQIADLVAYVASVGNGPPIPEVDPEAGDLALGQELYVDNCAPCHGATANGGAVGGQAFAPSLHSSAPLDVGEAIITGPGQMPKFAFSDAELDAVVRYVAYLQDEPAPGGLDIGGIGPVPEGFLAWGLGIVLLLLVVVFVARPGRDKGAL